MRGVLLHFGRRDFGAAATPAVLAVARSVSPISVHLVMCASYLPNVTRTDSARSISRALSVRPAPQGGGCAQAVAAQHLVPCPRLRHRLIERHLRLRRLVPRRSALACSFGQSRAQGGVGVADQRYRRNCSGRYGRWGTQPALVGARVRAAVPATQGLAGHGALRDGAWGAGPGGLGALRRRRAPGAPAHAGRVLVHGGLAGGGGCSAHRREVCRVLPFDTAIDATLQPAAATVAGGAP
jgi:hypothetical protein